MATRPEGRRRLILSPAEVLEIIAPADPDQFFMGAVGTGLYEAWWSPPMGADEQYYIEINDRLELAGEWFSPAHLPTWRGVRFYVLEADPSIPDH